MVRNAEMPKLIDTGEERLLDGSKFEMFACTDADSPNGIYYRFNYWDPTKKTDVKSLLRYDNAYENDEAGWHHRHVWEGGAFVKKSTSWAGLTAHATAFLEEVYEIYVERN